MRTSRSMKNTCLSCRHYSPSPARPEMGVCLDLSKRLFTPCTPVDRIEGPVIDDAARRSCTNHAPLNLAPPLDCPGGGADLWINVECAPGSSIDRACRSAVVLANRLGVTVWFDFNGVHCGARRGDDWELLRANWAAQRDGKGSCKVACANPLNVQGDGRRDSAPPSQTTSSPFHPPSCSMPNIDVEK